MVTLRALVSVPIFILLLPFIFLLETVCIFYHPYFLRSARMGVAQLMQDLMNWVDIPKK